MDLDHNMDAEDEAARRKEATLIQETDNGPRPEDGPQPSQDTPPDLVPEGATNQENAAPDADTTPEGKTQQPEQSDVPGPEVRED